MVTEVTYMYIFLFYSRACRPSADAGADAHRQRNQQSSTTNWTRCST